MGEGRVRRCQEREKKKEDQKEEGVMGMSERKVVLWKTGC